MSLRVDFNLFGLRDLIEAAFREDVGSGDLTVDAILAAQGGARSAEAHIIAKAPGVVAGLAVAAACYGYLDRDIAFRSEVKDGDRVEPGQRIARVLGPAGHLLTAERTALNFLGRLCGVATQARRYVDAVAGTGVAICDTRKTTPGFRMIEKFAAAQGGVTNHRYGLFDQVLIKENHLEAAGVGVATAVRLASEYLRNRNVPAVIGVETKDLAEFDEALRTAVDLILLDNFEPEQVAEAVRRRNAHVEATAVAGNGEAPAPRRPQLEASGGITLQNVRAYAETGVDRISVGAITHSAPVLDLSCLFNWRPATTQTGSPAHPNGKQGESAPS